MGITYYDVLRIHTRLVSDFVVVHQATLDSLFQAIWFTFWGIEIFSKLGFL